MTSIKNNNNNNESSLNEANNSNNVENQVENNENSTHSNSNGELSEKEVKENGHSETSNKSNGNVTNGNDKKSNSSNDKSNKTSNGNVNNTNGNSSSDKNKKTNGVANSLASKLELEQFRKVFVGSLNYSTTEDSLRQYFSKFGELIDCVIMKETKSNKSRGFGFVTYSKSSMVDELMKNRPHKLDGRELETKRATPREETGKPGAEMSTNKLFIGAIKETLNEEQLKDYFKKYGKINDCVIMKDKESNKSRGFGFITFDDYDPVDKIVLEKFHNINGQSIAVKKALPKDQTGGNERGERERDRGYINNRDSGPNYYNNGPSSGPNRNYNNYNNNNYNNSSYNGNFNGNYNPNYNDYDNDGYYPSNNYPQAGGSYNNNYSGSVNQFPSGSDYNSSNNSNNSGLDFANLALIAQKMLQAASMSQQPNNYGTGMGNMNNPMNNSMNGMNMNSMSNMSNNLQMPMTGNLGAGGPGVNGPTGLRPNPAMNSMNSMSGSRGRPIPSGPGMAQLGGYDSFQNKNINNGNSLGPIRTGNKHMSRPSQPYNAGIAGGMARQRLPK